LRYGLLTVLGARAQGLERPHHRGARHLIEGLVEGRDKLKPRDWLFP
jgi:hypothetical protein